MSDDGGFVPGEALELLRGVALGWARTLAERLHDAGIPCEVNPVGGKVSPDATFGVYVRPIDLGRARVVDAEVLRELVPDIPEGFDPHAQDSGRCPACEEPVEEGASECAPRLTLASAVATAAVPIVLRNFRLGNLVTDP